MSGKRLRALSGYKKRNVTLKCGFVKMCITTWVTQIMARNEMRSSNVAQDARLKCGPRKASKAQMWLCEHVYKLWNDSNVARIKLRSSNVASLTCAKLWAAQMWPTGNAKLRCGPKVHTVWAPDVDGVLLNLCETQKWARLM